MANNFLILILFTVLIKIRCQQNMAIAEVNSHANQSAQNNIKTDKSFSDSDPKIVQKVDENKHVQQDEQLPPKKENTADVESGTVIRGILVFVGIGLIFIVYISCKTYRRKHVPVIKKYGVRGNRSDVEMRPLPLDDDEDDETVFDLGNLYKP